MFTATIRVTVMVRVMVRVMVMVRVRVMVTVMVRELEMTTLRDWQKKASEKRDKLAGGIKSAYLDEYKFIVGGYFCAGFDSREHEIDLLIQIIEKQAAALERLTKVGPPSLPTTGAEWSAQCLKDNCEIARTTQAEVEALVEKLVKDERR